MSINNNEENINSRKHRNNFSIFRDNFFINCCRNENSNNDKKINDNNFISLEPLLFNKRLNEHNSNKNSRNMINSHSMVNIKSIYNKKKNDNFNNNFKPKPNIEEIPTFSFENDLNVKSFRIFMNRRNEILEKNLENFRKYMKNHEIKQKKNSLINPYSLYIKKINDVNNYEKSILPIIQQREMANKRLKLNKYEKQNNIINKINQSSFSTTNKNSQFDLEYYIEEVEKNRKERGINKELEIDNNRKEREINKQMEIEKENNIDNIINVSNSINNLKNPKKNFRKYNEISNPEVFYKKSDIEFYKYRNEQKKLGDYNYKIVLIHNKNRFIKKEPDINPFNQKINSFKVSDSSLSHNIILRPGESYGNFKCN